MIEVAGSGQGVAREVADRVISDHCATRHEPDFSGAAEIVSDHDVGVRAAIGIEVACAEHRVTV